MYVLKRLESDASDVAEDLASRRWGWTISNIDALCSPSSSGVLVYLGSYYAREHSSAAEQKGIGPLLSVTPTLNSSMRP